MRWFNFCSRSSSRTKIPPFSPHSSNSNPYYLPQACIYSPVTCSWCSISSQRTLPATRPHIFSLNFSRMPCFSIRGCSKSKNLPASTCILISANFWQISSPMTYSQSHFPISISNHSIIPIKTIRQLRQVRERARKRRRNSPSSAIRIDNQSTTPG